MESKRWHTTGYMMCGVHLRCSWVIPHCFVVFVQEILLIRFIQHTVYNNQVIFQPIASNDIINFSYCCILYCRCHGCYGFPSLLPAFHFLTFLLSFGDAFYITGFLRIIRWEEEKTEIKTKRCIDTSLYIYINWKQQKRIFHVLMVIFILILIPII